MDNHVRQHGLYHGFMGLSVPNSGDSVVHNPTPAAATDPNTATPDTGTRVSGAEPLFSDDFVRLSEADDLYKSIKGKFTSCLGYLQPYTSVAAIHKMSRSGAVGLARAHSFQIFQSATETNRGGNANVQCGWLTAPKEEIESIFYYGFSNCSDPDHGHSVYGRGLYGSSVCLFTNYSFLQCVKAATIGEDGLRHLLICRVIVGKPEVVHHGSRQCRPSSKEFDLGVDNLSRPTMYIVWSTHMNTHISPEYVVSFRAPVSFGAIDRSEMILRVISMRNVILPHSCLVPLLSRVLPKEAVAAVIRCQRDFKDKKIPLAEHLRRLRLIAGDKLLIAVCRDMRSKKMTPKEHVLESLLARLSGLSL